jgi:hypothetical protein
MRLRERAASASSAHLWDSMGSLRRQDKPPGRMVTVSRLPRDSRLSCRVSMSAAEVAFGDEKTVPLQNLACSC